MTAAEPGRRTSAWSPRRVVGLVGVAGLVLTVVLSWTARRIDRGNEHRLLQVQTRQAASVVGQAIVAIVSPLQAALEVASATGGDPRQFSRVMSAHTGPGAVFVSATLLRTVGASTVPVAFAGTPPAVSPVSAAGQALVDRARRGSTFAVTSVTAGGTQRVGYALTDRATGTLTVYAERAIPANRRVAVESDSAFSDIHFATYLGSRTITSAVQTTDVPLSDLPLSGDTARVQIPFGDSVLTMVASSSGHLGGALEANLAWVFLVGGLLLTALAASLAGTLVSRRATAERTTRTIAGLYERVDTLYAEQRKIAETLQRSLLPRINPSLPNLQIATRYVAGDRGTDIGGDWYSMIGLDDTHFAFVVGDVSGRGVEAAAVMARVRFTLRAYLLEGHSPDRVLQMCARQMDVTTDGHFTTVLVGVGDVVSRQITVANAGHLNPLTVSNGRAQFVRTEPGPPLGVTADPRDTAGPSYPATTFTMPAGSTLIAFTDGLVERRGEDLGLSLQRLAATAAACAYEAEVDAILESLLAGTVHGGSEDDIAVLAFTWTAGDALEPHSRTEPEGLRVDVHS